MTVRLAGLALRLMVLALLDGALLAGGWFGVPIEGVLPGHAALTVLGLALWVRGGGATGFAPAIFGMLGPIAVLAVLPLGRLPMRARQPVDADAVPGGRPAPARQRGASLEVARMLDGRVLHAPPEALSSLVTVMRHGDVGERRRALETVVRSFQPALSPLIALALTDVDQTIRALAAAAAARVAHNLALGRAALEARVADGDPGARAALAALLADHARADVLLSDSQRAHLRDDAVAILSADRPTVVLAEEGARDATLLEALWAAGDYAAIDRLAGSGRPVAAWWHAESAA